MKKAVDFIGRVKFRYPIARQFRCAKLKLKPMSNETKPARPALPEISPKYGKPVLGCYLEHGSRTVLQLSIDICELAFGYGWEETQAKDLCAIDPEELNDGDAELLSEFSEDAADWLNSQETRPFLYWANDGHAGAFGLWANYQDAIDGVEFRSTTEEQSPAADFRGLWLSISDHGNAELYLRDENGKDVSQWGIV